jgi:hypothetical protein
MRSRRRQAPLAILLAGTALVAVLAGTTWVAKGQRAVLTVEDARRGRVLLSEPVRPGERLILSYRHSVSRTRVTGVFEVSEGGDLIVRETTFGTFGPGLPELVPGDRYEVRDGTIRQTGLSQRLADLSVFVHPYTEHRLETPGRALDLSGTLAPGTLVRISARRG